MIYLIGAGLANSLIALRLHENRTPFEWFEKNDVFSNHKTWSFYATDLSASELDWISPLCDYQWKQHRVIFDAKARDFNTTYYSIRSESFYKKIFAHLGNKPFHQEAMSVQKIRQNPKFNPELDIIFNGTGQATQDMLAWGYQKFIGLDCYTEKPHGLNSPIIMDVTSTAHQNTHLKEFQFFYCLPLDTHQMLIEKTFYSLNPHLNLAQTEQDIVAYVEKKFHTTYTILRREQGSLAIPLLFKPRKPSTLPYLIPTGLKGRLFHYTTGYSVAYAVRTTLELFPLTAKPTTSLIQKYRRAKKTNLKNSWYKCTLNHLMFLGTEKSLDFYSIFKRFYQMREDLIADFFAGRIHIRLMLTLLKPPPPIAWGKGIKYLSISIMHQIKCWLMVNIRYKKWERHYKIIRKYYT